MLKTEYPLLWDLAQYAELWDPTGNNVYKYRPGPDLETFYLPILFDTFERSVGPGRAPLSFQDHAMQRMTGAAVALQAHGGVLRSWQVYWPSGWAGEIHR